jgi:casein kinase 1
MSKSVPSTLGENRFKVEQMIGQGCFGSIHVGLDTRTNEKVAVKFESKNCGAPGSLKNEHQLLASLAVPEHRQGFVEIFLFGKVDQFYCLVMELLSQSLEDSKTKCQNQVMSVRSTVLCAQQTLQRIEYLHSRSIVHRDIKPENFMWGSGTKIHHLYLIDFGMSCSFFERSKHVPMRTEGNLVGTARYASINTHRLCGQSRRDDLEAIGYMIIYIFKGKLPWSGLKIQDTVKKYQRIGEIKHQTLPEELCKGMPEGFATYLKYTRSLSYTERPDYQKLQMIMSKIRREHCPQSVDSDFDWLTGKELSDKLVPLLGWEELSQPDDLNGIPGQARESSGCLFFWRRSKTRGSKTIDETNPIVKGGTE